MKITGQDRETKCSSFPLRMGSFLISENYRSDSLRFRCYYYKLLSGTKLTSHKKLLGPIISVMVGQSRGKSLQFGSRSLVYRSRLLGSIEVSEKGNRSENNVHVERDNPQLVLTRAWCCNRDVYVQISMFTCKGLSHQTEQFPPRTSIFSSRS